MLHNPHPDTPARKQAEKSQPTYICRGGTFMRWQPGVEQAFTSKNADGEFLDLQHWGTKPVGVADKHEVCANAEQSRQGFQRSYSAGVAVS
jgi:hypothetical protein